MDVHRLRVLRELADRGSVTAVAAALSYTPSAVSQQLRALTAEVGVPLTEPAGRGVRLTTAGRALVSGSEDVFAALARAQATVDGLRHHPSGEVRVVLFPSAARMLLAGVLHRLAGTPEVLLRCRDIDMTPPDVPALAADFDVVVTHRYEYTEPLTAPRWTVVPLLREPLDVVLPPGHRLARRRTVRFSDLAEEAWISVDVGWPVDDVLRMLAVQTGISPRVVQRINDFGVTEELVAAGLGVALLPRYSTDDRGGRRLARRPLAGVVAARFVEAVLRTETVQRPAVQVVLEAMRAEADAQVRARR
jgi:DNA-binding transcriptional LysR family regulator